MVLQRSVLVSSRGAWWLPGGFGCTAWSHTWRVILEAGGAINKGHLYKISKSSGQEESRAVPDLQFVPH